MTASAWTITIVSLVLAVAFWLFPRQPKASLRYRITQNRPLFEPGALENLALYSDDVVVEQPWVFGVALTNDGRSPVRPADFDGPVVFDFSLEDELGFLQVTMVSELGGFRDTLNTVDGRSILSIEPILLNRGDRVEFVTLSDGQPQLNEVRGRLAGIGAVKEARRREEAEVAPRWPTRAELWVPILFVLGVAFLMFTLLEYMIELMK